MMSTRESSPAVSPLTYHQPNIHYKSSCTAQGDKYAGGEANEDPLTTWLRATKRAWCNFAFLINILYTNDNTVCQAQLTKFLLWKTAVLLGNKVDINVIESCGIYVCILFLWKLAIIAERSSKTKAVHIFNSHVWSFFHNSLSIFSKPCVSCWKRRCCCV